MTSILADWPAAAGPPGADAFTVLGLPYWPDLTDADVRAAYRLRLRAAHPDNGGDTQAAAAVTAAYDALRSAVRRGELLAAVTVDREAVSPPDGRHRRAGRRDRPAGPPDAAARAREGLPPFITDTATAQRINALLMVMQGREVRAGHPLPVGAAAPRDWPPPPPPSEPSTWRRQTLRDQPEPGESASPARPGGPAARILLLLLRAMRGRGQATRLAPRPYQPGRPGPSRPGRALGGSLPVRGWLRVRHGRPWWLAGRIIAAAGLVLIAQAAAPGDPAVWALGAGALTWLARTGRWDLAPRARR